MNGKNYGSYGSNGSNSGNYGYGNGQKKPEPPKTDLPEWAVPVGMLVLAVVIGYFSMPSDDRKALWGFFDWAGNILLVGGGLFLLSFWWMTQAETEGDAKARGQLTVTIFGFLLLILVVGGMLNEGKKKFNAEVQKNGIESFFK